tara:strand:- start:26 stop:202 length:177 start_codon:yes stop_codon:yes gene_type:complete
MIYRYVVSSTPENWAEGKMFASVKEARTFLSAFGPGCITEVAYEFVDTELVEDTREDV